jgi:transposase
MKRWNLIPCSVQEWRRLRAVGLKKQGWSQRQIAEVLSVAEETVSRWLARVRGGGTHALRARLASGRPPQLSSEQRRLIPEFLWHGPEAYGFRGQVWTCARVASVIQEEFGVRYHKDHVRRLLKGLRWTPQMPITRAAQRDEMAIMRWRQETWPNLQPLACRQRRALVFVDESGFYLLPGLVRTYAPEAQTPVLREKVTRDHLSVMGAMTPEGKVYTLVRQESLNGLDTIEFLMHLRRVAGPKLLVIWDGSPIHRRQEVLEFVGGTRGAIRVERLPGYAPDLNPWDEGGWHHLKHVEMRNLVCRDLEELHEQFHLAVRRLRRKPHLVKSFFAQAGLSLIRDKT